MATLTLKQVPDQLVTKLREEATRNRRSLNQQTILILERAIARRRPSFTEALEAFIAETGRPEPDAAEVFEDLRSRAAGRDVEL